MKTKRYHRRSIRLNGYDYAQNGNYFLTLCTRNRECLFGDVRDGKMYLSNYGKMVNECWQEIPVHFPQIVLHEYVIMPNHVHGIIEINNPQSTGANMGRWTDIVTIGANVVDVGANAVDDVGANAVDDVGANAVDDVGANAVDDVGANAVDDVGANAVDDVGANAVDDVGANAVDDVGANNYSPLRTPQSHPHGTSRTVGSVVRGFKIGVTKQMGFSPWQRNYYEHIIRNDESYQNIVQYMAQNPLKWEEDCFYFGINGAAI